jgi:hypothetical protein
MRPYCSAHSLDIVVVPLNKQRSWMVYKPVVTSYPHSFHHSTHSAISSDFPCELNVAKSFFFFFFSYFPAGWLLHQSRYRTGSIYVERIPRLLGDHVLGDPLNPGGPMRILAFISSTSYIRPHTVRFASSYYDNGVCWMYLWSYLKIAKWEEMRCSTAGHKNSERSSVFHDKGDIYSHTYTHVG